MRARLQHSAERLGGLLPAGQRYTLERRLRGFFEARRLNAADYVVVSFGKSGRTWLRVMISNMYERRYGLSADLIEFGNLHRRNAAVPRILFTHDNYLRDYTGHGASKRAYADKAVLLLVRHPADVAISQYFQWKHRMRAHKIALNGYPPRSEAISPYEFLMGSSGLHRVIGFMNEWAQAAQELPKLKIVRYEAMLADTVAEFGGICQFLSIPGYSEDLAAVVEYASFDNMKRREAQAQSASGRLTAADPGNPDSFKSRRAKAGGYKDYLDDDQLAEVERIIDSALAPVFGYNVETK